MQNPLGHKNLTLQESVQAAYHTQAIFDSQLSSTFDTLMSPSENLFWEYPGHHDYPPCTGWHPLGIA